MTGHGYGPYTNGCRCDICRAAKADYMRLRRDAARILAQESAPPRTTLRARTPGNWRVLVPGITHGTRYGYEERGCRCFDCTDARTLSDQKYRNRKAAR